MKKAFLLLTLFIIHYNGFCQTSFQKGYIINNSGKKIQCYIEIEGKTYAQNPTFINYKISENSKILEGNISSIKEFGIPEITKFIRTKVNIDQSSSKTANLSTIKAPIFVEKEVFLKVLIDGPTSLFSFIKKKEIRFFYKTDYKAIEPLIYKKYIDTDDQVRINNQYKQQLWNNLKCPKITMNSINKVHYDTKSLTKFFIAYNECADLNYINYSSLEDLNSLNLTAKLGINSSSLSIMNSGINIKDTEFDSEISFNVGVEIEIALPHKKNKWALVIEPSFHFLKAEKRINIDPSYSIGSSDVVTANYKALEIPIGFRHNMFLNKDSKLFLDAFISPNLSLNSEIDFERHTDNYLDLEIYDLEIKSSFNFVVGMGYRYDNKYSLELRYKKNPNLLNYYNYWESDYNQISLILGYTFN